MTPATGRGGRGWAYGGVVLGGAVSVAANVAHSYVPPDGASSGWEPMPGAVLGAVFWPVALFVAIEILARTGWPDGLPWRIVRLGGLLPVAVVAAVVSYRHLSGLIRFYGEDGLTATVGPLAVDGLMIVASAAIIASSAAGGAGTARTVAESEATESANPAPGIVPDAQPSQRTRPAGIGSPTPTAATNGPDATRRTQIQEAREYVRAEIQAGRTPTGAAVGRRFGRNSRWGQRMVRDAFAASSGSRPDPPDLPKTGSPSAGSSPLGRTVPAEDQQQGAGVHTKALQSDGGARTSGSGGPTRATRR